MAETGRKEDRYRRLFEEMDSGSALHEIILDESGKPVDYRFLELNPAFERQTGMVGSEVVGKTVKELLPNIEDAWIEKFGSVAVTGEPIKFDNYAADLEKHYQVTAYCPKKGQFAVIFNDVTALKKIEAELKLRQEELEAANEDLSAKNADLERFNYTVSHDLKSPLITIKGFMGMLKADLGSNKPDEVAKDIDYVCGAADKMDTLLEELLSFSRIGRSSRPSEAVSMTTVAREGLELVTGQVMARGATVEVQDGMPACKVNRHRLREVFQNLIDNAVKFSGDRKNPHIQVGCETVDDHCVFFVKDSGIGIDERYLETIFGLFDQLDQKIPGTGVGLAVAKRIVETHGGKIWAESPGKGLGTTIYFTLTEKKEPTDAA